MANNKNKEKPIVQVANRDFIWKGIQVRGMDIYGLSLENESFVYRNERVENNGDYVVCVLNRRGSWEKRQIDSNDSIWEAIQIGELQRTKVRIAKKRTDGGEKGNKETTKQNVPIKEETHAEKFIRVKLRETAQAKCRIAIKKFLWKNFVVQRGHIFGTFKKNTCFVSGSERRKSDDFIAIYISYKGIVWEKKWFSPDEEIAFIIFEGVKQRRQLGIYNVVLSQSNAVQASNGYAKQNFMTQTDTFHVVSSGGMVRPK